MSKTYQFGDLVEKYIDNRGKTPPLSENGIPLLEVKHLPAEGKYPILQTSKYVSQEVYNTWFRAHLEAGDLLFSTVGTTGRVSITPNDTKVAIAQNVLGLRFNSSLFDPSFAFYYLKSKLFQHEIESRLITTVQASIKRSDMVGIPIQLPEIPVQKSIVSVLGALDDKIENNRQMNKTLEEMARAIFKSWFFDFDPVHAKAAGITPAHMDAETAALFPSSFGNDGLPVGWVNNELRNVCSLLGGYAFKSKEFVNEGMPVVKIKNITGNGDVSLEDCQCIESKSIVGKDKFKLKDGDLLIAMTGATVGKTGIVTDGKMTPYLNQRVGKFFPNLSFHKWAIWAYLQFQKNVDSVVATGTGSAQTNISAAGILSVKWNEATHEIYKVFDEIVAPYFDLWISNIHQNQTLAELRDTLLPKLMSGEIRVKDAERESEAVV